MQNGVACCRIFAVHFKGGLADVKSAYASLDAAAKSQRCTISKSGCSQTENGLLNPQHIITLVLAQRS